MRISVFITSYNQRDYLNEAIESVLAQTLPPEQIIVVDDASSDGSPDLIADYSRRFPDLFTPIYHQKNTGVAQVRIDALNAVRGDYVTYVDGDDWFLPKKLELEVAALRSNPEARISFSNINYVREGGKGLLWTWVDGEPVPQGDVFWQTVARAFPRRNLFRMELVHYESWREIGFHDPRLKLYEDFDMRIRLTKKLKAVYVDESLACVRVHSKGLSKLGPEQHVHALNYLFYKNRSLLDSLSVGQRRKAIAGFVQWMEPIGFRAAKELFRKGSLIRGGRFWLAIVRNRFFW